MGGQDTASPWLSPHVSLLLFLLLGILPPFDTEQSYAVAAPSGANPQQIITKGAPEGETDLVNRFMAGEGGPPATRFFFLPFFSTLDLSA